MAFCLRQTLSRKQRSVTTPDNTGTTQSRSLCSWDYQIDHNTNRMPADIQVVTGCTNRLEGLTENKCDTVFFWVPVRVKGVAAQTPGPYTPGPQTPGPLTWVDSWQRLPVACTLANPPTNTPGPTTLQTLPPVNFL